MKAGEIYEKNLKESHDACTRYVEAARAYKNVNTAAAIKYYGIAVDMHMEGNRFSTAAKLYKDIAELYEKDMEYEGAKQAYTKAADCQHEHSHSSTAAATQTLRSFVCCSAICASLLSAGRLDSSLTAPHSAFVVVSVFRL